MSERINRERVKVEHETLDELNNRLQHRETAKKEIETDIFILRDVIARRFGSQAIAEVIDLHAYRQGKTEREFELTLFDDETPPEAS